jgi:hypothetical protein
MDEDEFMSPFVPMAIAFIGMGIALLVAIPFIENWIEILTDLGSSIFLLSLGSICAYFAHKKKKHTGDSNCKKRWSK